MKILFGNAKYSFQDELSSRPERTRISCHAALDKTACAPFRKEGRMKCDNATKFHRKSGVAKWRDLLFIIPASNLNGSATLPFVIISSEAEGSAVQRTFPGNVFRQDV